MRPRASIIFDTEMQGEIMDDSTNFLEKNKLTALAYIEGIGTQDL